MKMKDFETKENQSDYWFLLVEKAVAFVLLRGGSHI